MAVWEKMDEYNIPTLINKAIYAIFRIKMAQIRKGLLAIATS